LIRNEERRALNCYVAAGCSPLIVALIVPGAARLK
jgi:hypothetical protein